MLLPRESAPESLLTPEIRSYIYSQDWPKGHGLTLRLREQDTHLKLVVFRDEMIRLSGEELQQVANVMNRVLLKLRNDGIPIFFDVEATAKEESNG
jgi:hypothetical protein